MIRPCFLVVDREFPGSISTRKLVLETAKLNVITAYSGAEAIETLEKFPAVSGIVLDAGLRDMPHADLVRSLKKLEPKVPVIAISTPGSSACPEADYHLDFFEPGRLLALLQKLHAEKTAAIAAHDNALNKADFQDSESS